VAVLASRGLGPGLLDAVLNLKPDSVPEAAPIWQAESPGAFACSVDSAGRVLVLSKGSGGAPQPGTVTVSVVTAGTGTVALSVAGSLLAAGFRDSSLVLAPDGDPVEADEWHLVLASPAGFLSDDVMCLDEAGTEVARFRTDGEIATSGCCWADESSMVIGLYRPASSEQKQGAVVAIGADGHELWRRSMGKEPVHRVASRPGTGFIAAAGPGLVVLLDSHGNLLWSKDIRAPVADIAVQSHGGPAVSAGNDLLVYDRRGNLVWRKRGSSPIIDLDCSAKRIAVARPDEVIVFDEDGMERWRLTCQEAPVSVDLDPEGLRVAAVLESGVVLLAQAPGSAPDSASSVSGVGRAPWASPGRPVAASGAGKAEFGR
jgi:hypothetical protein